jgi:RecB family exonuclease
MATAEGLNRTVKIKGRRYYDVGIDKLFPSVTTILGAMTDKSGLDEWRKRVGEEKAEAIGKFSANRGTVMHQMIEYYLLSKGEDRSARLKEAQKKIVDFSKREGYTEEETEVGRRLFYNFYNANSFNQVAEIVSIEDTLYCHREGGYAGRVDTIYRKRDGRLIISDYKTSKKPKRLEWIENYLIQASAYFVAYWEMTGERPSGCEIWISNEQDPEPQIFEMDLPMIRKHAAKFLRMVRDFHAKYGEG